jgi:hypothetical protein
MTLDPWTFARRRDEARFALAAAGVQMAVEASEIVLLDGALRIEVREPSRLGLGLLHLRRRSEVLRVAQAAALRASGFCPRLEVVWKR